MKAQGMFREEGQPEAEYSAVLASRYRPKSKPSLAGPKRPQDRVLLSDAKANYQEHDPRRWHGSGRQLGGPRRKASTYKDVGVRIVGRRDPVMPPSRACTNTSNPAVMLARRPVGAEMLRQRAASRSKPWVKTSLAPGIPRGFRLPQKAELIDDLEALGFYTVGYGCTTCIGNSGPLKPEIAEAVTSGNDRRSRACCRATATSRAACTQTVQHNFLASPPLVVAYALAGRMDVDLSPPNRWEKDERWRRRIPCGTSGHLSP